MGKTLPTKIFWFLFFNVLIYNLYSQSIKVNPDLLEKEWAASWITYPDGSLKDYGVFHFRNNFDLSQKPSSFVVHVSADNRYRLFVNGVAIGFGPARGDIGHWNYESYDLAPHLKEGKNTLAAIVWNMGSQQPLAQQSIQTAFIVQGNSADESVINTGEGSWKCFKNAAYFPISVSYNTVKGYYAAGACDSVAGKNYPWGWEQMNYNDRNWLPAKVLGKGEPSYLRFGYGNYFGLTPRTIPMLEEQKERFSKVVRSSSNTVTGSFLEGGTPLVIPKKSKTSILIDKGALTVGYPELFVSGGSGSTIKVIYAEALFDKDNKKGHRDSVNNKIIKGYYDVFMPDGKSDRVFRPLWTRTFRYVQLDIETAAQPLTIKDYNNIFTAYPFKENAKFESNDSTLRRIWNVGWRTARLCAAETYYDCPYYEQLQYIGDTRIQSLISLYASGDDKLMKNAILQFDQSKISDGITMSRYPTGQGQIIPPFSLIWVSMVNDYNMHRTDTAFVKQLLPGVESVLGWFESKLDRSTGMLGKLPWWNFADWSKEFKRGVPPGAETGSSALITLQYANALDDATALFYYSGKKSEAKRFADMSELIKKAVYKHCFDSKSGLIADTPEKKSFSQHVNLFGILTDAVPAKNQKEVMQKVLADKSLTQCSIYFKFYLIKALKKAGLAEQYLELLDPWKKMLNEGLTTFAETDVDTRSDCHAWSASPNYDFLATICGIQPQAPGFSRVEIEPALGKLEEVTATMPHPLGNIELSLKKTPKGGLIGEVTLPEGLSGNFIGNGKTISLRSGCQAIY
jgi:alpha-L-rhamnosidase